MSERRRVSEEARKIENCLKTVSDFLFFVLVLNQNCKLKHFARNAALATKKEFEFEELYIEQN